MARSRAPTHGRLAPSPASSASASASAGLAGRGRVRGRLGLRVRGSCGQIALLLGGEAQEGAHRRHFARRRRRPEPVAAALGEEGAQVDRGEVDQAVAPDRFAAMPAEEVDQAMRGGDIGAHGVRRAAAVEGEMARPARGERRRRVLAVASPGLVPRPPPQHSAERGAEELQQLAALVRRLGHRARPGRAAAARAETAPRRRARPALRRGRAPAACPNKGWPRSTERSATSPTCPAARAISAGSQRLTPSASMRNPWSPISSASATQSSPSIAGQSLRDDRGQRVEIVGLERGDDRRMDRRHRARMPAREGGEVGARRFGLARAARAARPPRVLRTGSLFPWPTSRATTGLI